MKRATRTSFTPEFRVVAALVGLLTAGCLSGAANGASSGVCVGTGAGCVRTIQAGLDAAQDGDAITVEAGTFEGGVRIEKSVKLIGAGAAATVVEGGGPVVTVGSRTGQRSLTVSIAGLRITGGLSSTNPSGRCGADVPECGPGYLRATALAGGIEIAPRATVTISNSVVTGNRATPTVTAPSVSARCPNGPCPFAYGGGGGIDNWGKLTLVDTTVSDNTAGGGITAQADGAGILSESGGTLTLVNSTVKRNRVTVSAPNGRFAAGGAIYVDGGALSVRGSTVSSNRTEMAISMPRSVDVSASCAGICLESGATAAIRGTLISGNVISGSNDRGNGVWCGSGFSTGDGGSFTLSDSTVSNNRVTATARSTSPRIPLGSEAFLVCSGAADLFAARVRISNSRIVGNSISARTTSGSALAVAGAVSTVSPNAVITNTLFSRNSATAFSGKGPTVAYGGAIGNGKALTFRRSRVTGNSVRAASRHGVARGGGIFDGQIPDLHQPGRIRLVHSVVAHNRPDQCSRC
jgi:Right handed beta helix region